MTKVRPEDISVEIMAQLEQYSDEVAEEIKEEVQETASECLKEIKQILPQIQESTSAAGRKKLFLKAIAIYV